MNVQGTVGVSETTRSTVWLFSLCFMMAQADKQVLGLLAVPIQRQFALSNAQLGLLQGAAFAVAYAIAGVPIARLLDTGRRIPIAAACVALWSLATMGSGLAASFAVLVLCRSATAIAEAGLPPAAFSIFAQSRDQRTAVRLTSAFMLAPFVGGGLALLVGGAILHVFPQDAPQSSHWLQPWRAVLILVGAPGVALAALLARFGREPAREFAVDGAPIAPIGRVLSMIFVESRFLRSYYAGITFVYLLVATIAAWYPALLIQAFGMTASSAGAHAGLLYLGFGVVGTLYVNAVTRARRAFAMPTLLRTFVAVAGLLAIAGLAMPLVGQRAASLAVYSAYAFLSAIIISSMPMPIQLSLSDEHRARGTAIASLMMSGIAGTAGPWLVGMLTDQAGMTLAHAIAAVGGGSAIAATLCLVAAWWSAPSGEKCARTHPIEEGGRSAARDQVP